MSDVDRPNEADAVSLLLRLANASDPDHRPTQTVNDGRRDDSSESSEADFERCHHGFTAGQFCDTCDREAS